MMMGLFLSSKTLRLGGNGGVGGSRCFSLKPGKTAWPPDGDGGCLVFFGLRLGLALDVGFVRGGCAPPLFLDLGCVDFTGAFCSLGGGGGCGLFGLRGEALVDFVVPAASNKPSRLKGKLWLREVMKFSISFWGLMLGKNGDAAGDFLGLLDGDRLVLTWLPEGADISGPSPDLPSTWPPSGG